MPEVLLRFNCKVPADPFEGVPEPVDALTVQVDPDPDTPVTVGVPVSPDGASEKLPFPTPTTDSLKVTVHDTEDAFVGEAFTRVIDCTVGASLSNVYASPTTGTEPPSTLPALSWIWLGELPLLVRFRPIEPLFVPVVATVTVQVAVGAEPTGVAEVIVGAVPVNPIVTNPKSPATTFFTGSLNVTVQCSGFAFVGFASARLIDDTVGGVVSITHA
jgi:hypothetical protein